MSSVLPGDDDTVHAVVVLAGEPLAVDEEVGAVGAGEGGSRRENSNIIFIMRSRPFSPLFEPNLN